MTFITKGNKLFYAACVAFLVSRMGTYNGIQKFGFINGVDNVNWPPYRDSQS